ncbi:MAG: tetratricopeptide repeat protein [Woeseia sp.]|nr:sulfotransferase [Woeseia sp.]NNE60971.1 tetratricopeptide repeat protein [Woeseia sp.]
MSNTSPDSDASLKRLLEAGFRALDAGRLDEAGEACRKALAIRRDYVQAHFLVGLIALEMQDKRTAIRAFGSITKLRPEHAAAWAQLARLFARSGQANRADKALAAAIAHEENDAIVQNLIGVVCTLLGEHHDAREWHRKAAQAFPDNVPYVTAYANSLIYLGETQPAEEKLRHALTLEPNNAQANWLLAGVHKARDSKHIDAMRSILATTHLPPQFEAFLCYAIGKELEDLERWPEAYAAFARGAAARRKVIEFNEAAEIAMYETLEKTYTGDWLSEGPAGNPSASPIFVVGQPRTGTTLIERIITSHSAVHSAGELQHFGLSIRRLTDYQQPERFSAELMASAATVEPNALGSAYLRSSERLTGELDYFVDKLPQNYLYLPLILKALPNAKIVHLVRDPIDACFASFKQLFADAYPHSYDLEEMARHHARYRHLMSVWRERFGDRFLDISYEDTARDLEPNARRLIDWLGLPWEDACLDFHQQRGAVTTASAVQVREPVHTRSIGRWQRYATELEPLIKTLNANGVAC